MIRRQLPVASPISPLGLLAGMRAVAFRAGPRTEELADRVGSRYGARATVLTDSGTSALVLALRTLVPSQGTVALPAYGCIDLTAAVVRAGVRVRLYDVDPFTLSANLDSVAAVLRRGVDALVVAHLYGFPVEVRAVAALCAAHDVPIIEDAAQGAGGSLDGRALGSFGHLTVLSFGRGKGTCAGRGGALLALDARRANHVSALAESLGAPGRGVSETLAAAAQWIIGRPMAYGIPASIPALHLGEMVYHPANEPSAMTHGARALLRSALALDNRERQHRRVNARRIANACRDDTSARLIRAVPGGESGYLRQPMLDMSGVRRPAPHAGVLRGYPMMLSEHSQLQPLLHDGEPSTPGARMLRDSLFTLPTHSFVRERDVEEISAWWHAPVPALTTALEPLAR